MKQGSRFTWTVILSLVGLFCLIIAQFEPKPGRHSWFLGLAGDPSVMIDDTPFEIGPSTDRSRTFEIFKWEMIRRPDFTGEVPKVILGHVLEYNSNGNMIAVITTDGKALINVASGAVIYIDEKNPMLPEASAMLYASTKRPVMSRRSEWICGGIATLFCSLIIIAHCLVSRKTSA